MSATMVQGIFLDRIAVMFRHRRRLLLFGLLTGVTVAVMLVAWLFLPQTAITPENAAKIRKGMSLADVQSLLGGPSRNVSTRELMLEGEPLNLEIRMFLRGNDAPFPARRTWISDTVIVIVIFDENGIVDSEYGAEIWGVQPVPEGLVDKVRHWLHL